MRAFRSLIILTSLMALPSFAQVSVDPAQDGQPPATERRDRFRQSIMERFGRLAQELDLDAQQRSQFEKTLSDFADRMVEEGRTPGQVRELGEGARRAEEAGEPGKAEEARGEMRRRRGSEMWDEFTQQIDPILRPEQREKMTQMRASFGERRRGGEDVRERIDALKSQLDLTPDQTKSFDELRARLDEQLPPRTGPESMPELMRAMRDAEQAGDTARVDELRQQMTQYRDAMRTSTQNFYQELNGILTAAQRETLTEIRLQAGRFGAPEGDRAREGRADPRAAIRAARRLELTDEQKQQIEQIEAEAGKQVRDAGRDREATQRIAQETEAKIRELLTPEQSQEYTKALAEMRSAGRRGGPGGEGEEGRPARRPRAERPSNP